MEPPLVIDLDGTLLRTDLLHETWLMYLRDKPHRFLTPLNWIRQGKAQLKQRLAHAVELDVTVLPYDQTVISFIESERRRGRRVILATASHVQIANKIAHHLQLFDQVIATHAKINLSGDAKRDALVQAFGTKGFDYAGNSQDDLPVWAAARLAYLVNASAGTQRRAKGNGNVAGTMNSGRPGLHDWAMALRVHQWLKNLLVFVPLLAAHRYAEMSLVLDGLLAFICFSLCASSVYVLNDLLDLREDRHHARKRIRPFAAGRLGIRSGLALLPLLLIAAFGIALTQLPFAFAVVLATYLGLTLAYTLELKRRIVIDVIVLAALYTVRVLAGAAALDISLSSWLIAFSMFIFLSLALVKRYAELSLLRVKGEGMRAPGRGYFPQDLEMIAALGVSSAYISVLVVALYVTDPQTSQLYGHPEFIWLACPVLLAWISRVWMLAHRGEMNEDPVMFAVGDKASLLLGALLAIVIWAAV